MTENLAFALKEASLKKEISQTLIENTVLEILVHAFRLAGEQENEETSGQTEHELVYLAQQYIEDNVEMAPSVAEVAEYCNFSTKQLTRIFKQFADTSPGEYIIKKRIKKIEKLLSDPSLSLKQISELMHFGNEYYFNLFFKKYSGMPPGEYRKMLGK